MSLANTFDQLLGSIQSTLQTTLTAIAGSLMQQIQASLGGLTGKRSVNIQAILTQVEQILPIFTAGSLNVQNILNTFSTQIGQFLTSLNKPQARSAFLAASQQAKGDLTDAFNSLLNEALGHLQSIATSLANVGLASVLGALQGGKRGIFDGLGDILNNITSTLTGHVNNITSSVVDLGSNLLGAVTPHLQDLQDQLTNHALNAAQSLLGTLAGISGTLQG